MLTLVDYLQGEDAATRPARVRRAAELIRLGEPINGRMLFGDCLTAFREAQASYVHGNFLSTVLATQACLEKLLSGFIETWAFGKAPRSYASLLRHAHDERILTDYEYGVFDALRRGRNPQAHFRDVNHPEHPMQRFNDTGERPYEVLRSDASAAVHALIGLVNRRPFALGPVVVQLSEDELTSHVHPEQLTLEI